MISQKVARALFLAIFAGSFLFGALQLPIGQLAHPGPGLFPVIVSLMLLTTALLIGVQAYIGGGAKLDFNPSNIAIIISALTAFVVGSKFVNVAIAVILLVFISSIASSKRSWKQNVVVSVVLILIALAFQKLLGLNLRVI